MRIVVAVDDSRHSERAVEFLTQMRWPAGSRVIVVTVVQPASVAQLPPDGPAVLLSDALGAEQAEYLESIVRKAEQCLRASGFSVEGRVLFGDPRMVLLSVAQDERADLLVLGSHGRTGLAKLLIGSVSSHSVTHAPCSVLVVKDTAHVGVQLEPASVEHETLPATKVRKQGVIR